MAYSKIILNGETLMDVTGDTVDSGNLLDGETATKNSGAKVTGSLTIPVTDVEVNGTSVVDDGVAEVTVPTKVSDLTNDSGYITGYTETDPTVPSWAKQSSKPSYTASEVGAVPTSRTVNGKALSSNITLSASDVSALPSSTNIPSKTSDLTNDSGFITGYTETDPIFTASPAYGITSADITNWDNKVSDDKTWNGVTLDKSTVYGTDFYVPNFSSTSADSAKLTYVTTTPSAGKIPRYDGNDYLISTTPSANDNSTKVATTAYVKSSIPTKVSDLVNDSGFITGVTSTSTPTASTISEFDSSAHMNSTDMSSADVSTFVSGLNVSGASILDMFYPVGSYYETSDGTFDPNVAWGGTWALENAGQVHVSAGTGYTLGATGGEASHTLTINELPANAYYSNYVDAAQWGDYEAANAHYYRTKGGGQAHNNMPPYIVVNRWHRTA